MSYDGIFRVRCGQHDLIEDCVEDGCYQIKTSVNLDTNPGTPKIHYIAKDGMMACNRFGYKRLSGFKSTKKLSEATCLTCQRNVLLKAHK